jgi:hypothetical protein
VHEAKRVMMLRAEEGASSEGTVKASLTLTLFRMMVCNIRYTPDRSTTNSCACQVGVHKGCSCHSGDGLIDTGLGNLKKSGQKGVFILSFSSRIAP